MVAMAHAFLFFNTRWAGGTSNKLAVPEPQELAPAGSRLGVI
jgi:hypothetical protein